MFSFNGGVLKELIVFSCGHTELDFFCFYRYKNEYEPKINKLKYPNIEDRWYEDYMTLWQITEAKLSGVNVDITRIKDRIEWEYKHNKFILKKDIFVDESDYYKQYKIN